jgi:cytochrome P450/NADPH-cytochrome P450 reductase
MQWDRKPFSVLSHTNSQEGVISIARFLKEAGNRATRPKLMQNYLVPSANAQYEADKKVMMDLTHESTSECAIHMIASLTSYTVIRKRKENPSDVDDLLGLMLTGKDVETGLGLSDERIAYNLVTYEPAAILK